MTRIWNPERKPLEWSYTDRGTWIAEGYMWGYELIRNPNAKDVKGQPMELWNIRVWRLLAENPRRESHIIGGYRTVEHAKHRCERDEANPTAAFKDNWFDLIGRGK